MRSYYGRIHGPEYDAQWWAAVKYLFGECFPGMPDGIMYAEKLGLMWPPQSTPFTIFEGAKCLAHVGVLVHPMYVNGKLKSIAGIHAVCTTPTYQKQGLCRELLKRALDYIDESFEITKLHTFLPQVYEKHGFRVVPTYRFRSQLNSELTVRKVHLHPQKRRDDLQILLRILAKRQPISHVLASADTGVLTLTIATLSDLMDYCFWLLPEYDAIVAIKEEKTCNVVLDVWADSLPKAEVILAAVPRSELPTYWAFKPDLFDTSAQAELFQDEGFYMVRGSLDLGDAKYGISPVWQC